VSSEPVRSKDYGRQYRAIWDEIEPALRHAMLDDDPILGDAVTAFERELARYHHVRHAVGVNSGMAALALGLKTLGVGPGDEVITGAHTFTGTVSAIVLAGATPVLVDPEGEDGLLTPEATERAITPRTRCVLPVHFYGHPVAADALRSLCDAHGIMLFEDGAQAHGAHWKNRPIGSFGHACALSFHPSKNLGAFGDGGAFLTDDEGLAESLRVRRNLGKNGKYTFGEVSSNEKLDTLQAAILSVKLRHLDAWIERRNALAARYTRGLRGVGDLKLPSSHPDARHAWHLYVVRTSRRDALKEHLGARGVQAGLHYPIAAHRQPAHAERFRDVSLPNAEAWAASVLTLPLSHEHEDAEIDRVIEAVREFYGA
jgi:dTDP-3-amino-3,4,6-trideoxy-alpha-D-glucose transaminase